MGPVTGIRAVRTGDLGAVRTLLHTAFRADPVSCWIFPEEERREARHPYLFGAFLSGAFLHGTAEMTQDGLGVALWFAVRDGEQVGAEELTEGLKEVDPGNERLGVMGRATAECHPHEDHAYLQGLAVAPEEQDRGIGSALLRHGLSRCDEEGLPAYLEASSERSRALYARYGFEDLGKPVELPEAGPTMWPMWRPAHASGRL
ncbi:GNAT family N-acetyltransferase [Streptomyces iconiensis]|uniref:GNAT family N-acetyltransferase n=1 Tax=Streptomyces iconiensis TaxID=1384038 RepID=A0ABT7A364_9ACTN|nr:GNAT family N-acetyltransferase [Streptomyces iconiensis]MDJ1135519.1 GNAT family N-acetyltransferase [Streptomyces iconiensis]